ncbi:MAG: cyclic nucleotide-binding and patatin-like phospholipase domain-containing protein [Bryobacteraceae bacterium]
MTIGLLEQLDFFRGLNPDILRDVASKCTESLVAAGEVLFRQGAPSDCVYIVSNGRLDVSFQPEGHASTSLYEAGRGQIVGEMGLLTGAPRSATVTVLRDSVLFQLRKEDFDELLEAHPALTRRIACSLSERVRRANVHVRADRRNYVGKTFAVFPAGEVAPTAEFAKKLAEALNEIGPTRLITKAVVEQAVGTGDMNSHAAVQWLNDQEAEFDFLVYESDLHPSGWTSRCMCQADRLLSVARSEARKERNEIEQIATYPRVDLVLLHREPSFRPSGTPQWLEGRKIDRHHHICSDSPKDFIRLARILAGKAVGLVLGGGGARGFAHIGAIKAIEEAGITIETIGGTSQGAMIAAQYAMGWTPAQIMEANRKVFRDFRPLTGDRTLPFFSFVTGVTSNRGLKSLFAETHISDLKVSFFCVSTNLSLAKLVVNPDTLVWKSVRCSMALPGLMPPVILNKSLLIDGGVLNNLPVDIMRQKCNGEIIAVDVSPPNDLLVTCEDRVSLGFLEFIARRKKHSLPNLFEILMRTGFLSSIHHREVMAADADLLIHPPMNSFGLLEWDKLDTLVEIGYRVTREKLRSWTGSTTIRDTSGQSAGPKGESDPEQRAETAYALEEGMTP